MEKINGTGVRRGVGRGVGVGVGVWDSNQPVRVCVGGGGGGDRPGEEVHTGGEVWY